jgi:hypothetical protein
LYISAPATITSETPRELLISCENRQLHDRRKKDLARCYPLESVARSKRRQVDWKMVKGSSNEVHK